MAVGARAQQAVNEPRIVGIVLARNEDTYLERVVRNAASFCDEWIFCDHDSADRTAGILGKLAEELPSASLHPIRHPRESHELIRPLAGANAWVFGLDGDEIYDPAGLARMRARLLSGEFTRSWMILGNVLHVTGMSADGAFARGHLAPPCRSMTKLYNFAAIDAWRGYCAERLHGGNPAFRKGFSAGERRNLYEECGWDGADFRCLHLCFSRRSSLDREDASRRNIMETYGTSRWRAWLEPFKRLASRGRQDGWKEQRYRRGPEVSVDARPFFPDQD